MLALLCVEITHVSETGELREGEQRRSWGGEGQCSTRPMLRALHLGHQEQLYMF